MKLLTAVLCFVTFSALAAEADRVEEDQKLRDQAKGLVQKAYELSKTFCAMYPSAEHTVVVTSGNDELAVTVKCEIVNAYFAGKLH